MKYDVKWGDGCSDMFIEVKDGKPVLLDYEYDTERLHEMCGGKCYYCSRSGASGAGYFRTLGSLIRVGAYRVDSAAVIQWFEPVGKLAGGKQVLVAVPYASHTPDKSEILRDFPVVVKYGLTVVYCDFENLLEVLSLIFSGKSLPEECVIDGVTYNRRGHRTIRRTLTKLNEYGEVQEEEVSVELYNLSSTEETSTVFLLKEMQEYMTIRWYGEERMFRLLSVEKLSDGTFVRLRRFLGFQCRGEILPGNPLETGELTAGWQREADDVLVRFYDKSNEVHIVAYAKADEAYGKASRRLATRLGEGEEFISFVGAHEGEYVEFEVVVPKVLYLLDPAAQLAEVRRGLARKVRKDVFARARRWTDDRTVLDSIPDDTIVTLEDSYSSGNCVPVMTLDLCSV